MNVFQDNNDSQEENSSFEESIREVFTCNDFINAKIHKHVWDRIKPRYNGNFYNKFLKSSFFLKNEF